MGCCGGLRALLPAALLGPPELEQRRRPICDRCPELVVIGSQHFCGPPMIGGLLKPSACGCWLEKKWRMADQRCPQGRW